MDTFEFKEESFIIQFAMFDNVLKTQVAFFTANKTFESECQIKYIPTKSNLYSKSKGLLEVSYYL